MFAGAACEVKLDCGKAAKWLLFKANMFQRFAYQKKETS